MTQVTGKSQVLRAFWLAMLVAAAPTAQGQPASSSAVLRGNASQNAGLAARPAETLYLQLRSVGLDPARTFHVRGASLDRSALHITLEDGDISFTRDVAGHVTGAFFQGDGDLLLTPPNHVERAAMASFTGMAILEERFATGYLRFNDDTFSELKPYLRPCDQPDEFSHQWDETAHNLAESDALRLLATFSRELPVAENTPGVGGHDKQDHSDTPPDRVLHARLQGVKLGPFDAYFDSLAPEQLWAGQSRVVDGVTYYDLWTSFATSDTHKSGEPPSSIDDFALSAYKITANVHPPTTLSADTTFQMDVRRGGARTVFFELSRYLQVKQVEADGLAKEFINNTAIDGTQLAKRGNDLVAVIFPAPLRAGQHLEMRFVYSGDVLSEAGGGLLYVGARGTWYPNRGMAMVNFDLEFHYPAGWSLVATGKRTTESRDSSMDDPTPTGETVARWVTERPSALAGFNLGKYERATARAGAVTVEAYAAKGVERTFPRTPEEVVKIPDTGFPRPKMPPLVRQPFPPSPARNAQAVADRGARAVSLFSEEFGPYPYSSLELTQMPGDLSQGWPGLVFLSSFAFLTPEQESDLHLNPIQTIFSRLALEHETAHQWWGDLVGWRSYHDQWIVEALANYSALMLLEGANPPEFRKAMDAYRTDLLGKNKDGEMLGDAGPVTLGVRLNSSHFPHGYEAVSYGRGTWLIHMLRYMLRDAETEERQRSGESPAAAEPFMRALRRLRERCAGTQMTARDLQAAFEEELPRPLWYEGRKSLDWFFESWVRGIAVPHLSLQNVKYVPKAGKILISGQIAQKGGPQDLVTAVPIYSALGGKSTLVGTVFADGPETAFQLTAPAGTRRIVLDPNQTLLTSPR